MINSGGREKERKGEEREREDGTVKVAGGPWRPLGLRVLC